MLHKFLTYFSRATTDETLVASMFNVAATRYFNAVNSCNHDQMQREAIGYSIASRVRSEHMPVPSLKLKQVPSLQQVEMLPPRLREVMRYKALLGKSVVEIAEHLGITVKTVELRLHRAALKLNA